MGIPYFRTALRRVMREERNECVSIAIETSQIYWAKPCVYFCLQTVALPSLAPMLTEVQEVNVADSMATGIFQHVENIKCQLLKH